MLYTITDLGFLPGDSTGTPEGLNMAGHVCGSSDKPDFSSPIHGFFYDGSGMMNIGGFGSPVVTWARAINNGGAVVGLSNVHAFQWTAATGMQVLAGLQDAFDINATGWIVGTAVNRATAGSHAVRRDPATGALEDLGVLPGTTTSIANAVNDAGQVAGASSWLLGETIHAFLWTPNGGMQDLGTLPGKPTSYACDLNNKGEVAGISWGDGGGARGFRWSQNTGMMELLPLSGFTSSTTSAINDHGDIVGWSGGAGSRATLWSKGIPIDLTGSIENDTGWDLSVATAINSAGQIVGRGRRLGQEKMFLLTPVLVNLPRIPRRLPVQILAGIIDDSSGVLRGPNGTPIPVDPWDPRLTAHSVRQNDQIVGVLLSVVSDYINDDKLRSHVQSAVNELLRRTSRVDQ